MLQMGTLVLVQHSAIKSAANYSEVPAMKLILNIEKRYAYFIVAALVLLIFSILSFAETGLENPPGELVEDAVIFTVSPTTFTLSSTQTEIQITLTAKDPYVYKDAYFCKAPCRQLGDWTLLGEFTGTPKGGNYFDGKGNGVSNQFTIPKANLNNGNNFVAVYTCKGYNDCNGKRWVKQKFVVTCSTQFLQNIGGRGSADGQFLNYGPRNVALDNLGNIYVTESNMLRIQKFSSTGQFITKWGSQGSGDG